jgi:hypothetical protein
MTENLLSATILSMSRPFTWNDVRRELDKRAKTPEAKISDLDIEVFLQALLLQGFLKRRDWKYTLSL